MLYSEVRPAIETGDLLAWRHEGWGSLYDLQIQIVRMATRSEYSHVGLAWKVGGRLFCLEAVGSGIRIMPLSLLGDFYFIPMLIEEDKFAIEFALSKVGEKYSKWQAITSFFGKVKEDGRWQCAEYVNRVLEESGFSIGERNLTPSKVVEAVQELYQTPLYFVES